MKIMPEEVIGSCYDCRYYQYSDIYKADYYDKHMCFFSKPRELSWVDEEECYHTIDKDCELEDTSDDLGEGFTDRAGHSKSNE